MRTVEPDHHGVRVRRLDRCDRLVFEGAGRGELGTQDTRHAGDHVVGIEGRTVVKDHVVAQRERPGEPLGVDAPFARQRRNDRAVAVRLDQGIVQAARHLERERSGGGVWIEGVRLAGQPEYEFVGSIRRIVDGLLRPAGDQRRHT